MISFLRFALAGAFALSLVGPVFAGDTTAPQDASAAAHAKLMSETICRNLDEDDTGSRVHHRTCMTRSEWLAYDKRQKGGFDPDTGRVVVKE
jgi:hypothetical protein